jgi:aryl-alcohol dehydrogenase-like predicted oxidoreductase
MIVGGHSFIPELGNDPAIGLDAQISIVSECLDRGINCFDTTYEPERIALGRILQETGRRDEAMIIAWNFFKESSSAAYLVGPRPFEAAHLERLLSQLRTDYIDMLVVHPVGDAGDDERQLGVAETWVSAGHVGSLGTWKPCPRAADIFGRSNPYDFMVTVRNAKTPNSDVFAACKTLGWRTVGTSPFDRGWLLDRLVEAEATRNGDPKGDVRARIADALLRYSFMDPNVDHLMVGIRKKAWIGQNLESLDKGPLAEEEHRWICELANSGQGTSS